MSTTAYPPRRSPAYGALVDTVSARLPQVREHYRLHPLVVIYLLTVVIPIGFHLGSTFLNLQRTFLLVMIIPMLISFLGGRAGKFIPTDFLFLFALIWIPIALSQTTPEQAITFSASVGMEFYGGYLVGRLFIRTRADFIALCRWLVLIVLCLLPLAVFEALTNRPPAIELINQLPNPFRAVRNVQHEPRMGLFRAQTVFVHPIFSGLFCSIAFSLCYVGLQGVFSDTRRLICSALIFLTGFLSLSSGALLALLLQMGLITWALVFRKSEWRWWLLFGLFVLAYIAIDIFSTRTPIRVFMTYATFNAWTAYWRSIIFDWGMMNIFGSVQNGIPPARLFGIGLNDWVRPHFMRQSSVDNFWLATGLLYGVPGVMAIMLGYGALVAQLMRLRLAYGSNLIPLRRALVFTFLGLAFTLCTVHVWTQVFSFVCFMLGSATWLLHAKAEDTAQPAAATADPKAMPAGEVRRADPGRAHLPHSRFAHRPVQRLPDQGFQRVGQPRPR